MDVSAPSAPASTLFTGSNVQRRLGKWNAAVAAAMLRMWPEVRKQAMYTDADTWSSVTGLHAIPAELQPLLAVPAAAADKKLLGYAAVYVRHMQALGLRAYIELARRMEALAFTLLPVQFAAARNEWAPGAAFATTALKCANLPSIQDKALGAAAAYVMVASASASAETLRVLCAPVGSQTPAPLSWRAPRGAQIVAWDTDTASFPVTQCPRGYWALIQTTEAEGNDSIIAWIDSEQGVREWTLPPDAPRVQGWQWIVSSRIFRPTHTLTLIGTRGASEFLLDDNQSVAALCKTVDFKRAARPRAGEKTLGRSGGGGGHVGWHAACGSAVMFDLHTLAVHIMDADHNDSDTLVALVDEMANTHDLAAQENFIYSNGQIMAVLPDSQSVAALCGNSGGGGGSVSVSTRHKCVDVFTRANDWWRLRLRLLKKNEQDWEAHVVGLNLPAGWRVADVCE